MEWNVPLSLTWSAILRAISWSSEVILVVLAHPLFDRREVTQVSVDTVEDHSEHDTANLYILNYPNRDYHIGMSSNLSKNILYITMGFFLLPKFFSRWANYFFKTFSHSNKSKALTNVEHTGIISMLHYFTVHTLWTLINLGFNPVHTAKDVSKYTLL